MRGKPPWGAATRQCIAIEIVREPLLVRHEPLQIACPDTRRSNKPCATTISTPSVCPDSLSLPKLNLVEPAWYGPVCPVVWEGWHREMSPYPDCGGMSLRSRSLKEGSMPDEMNNLLGNDS